MKKFLGAPYPIVRHARGLLRTQDGVDQIKSDLLQLLLTNPGERVMLPEFGTPLRELLFEPNTPALEEIAFEMISNSIKTWEPRIAVSAIEVSTNIDKDSLHPDDPRVDEEHIFFIRILFFDPQDIQNVQELKLELPLST
jgi:phage baseplate assembly protein W